ncbi:nucleotide disphospho-sugar-binding domain-containing protein [Catenuloplanes japonicus]|uniref:nucleotide disphospho-sugar-binding domain-containing protein n=1 Tax=Catenuloplanes japonicus TaxID=33876 RepID=UPI0012FC45AA|nr:nucleotide disphospho-sugar-binding domain-containing protein [Catenuloplanes japonicus]
MAKIVVATPPIPGETLPMLRLARLLAARGHEITVLAGSEFRDAAERSGLTFVALRGKADSGMAEFMAAREESGLPPGAGQIAFDWIHLFVEPAPDQYRSLQAILERDPDQYLITNNLFLGAFPIGMGAPGPRPRRWAAVSVMPLVYGENPGRMGMVPVRPGGDQRAADEEFASALGTVRDRMSELLHELGAEGEVAPLLDAIFLAPDATAILTVPGFEFHRDDMPPSVHLVGSLPVADSDDWTPPEWWSDLDGSRPVVAVTQGTFMNSDLSQLVEPTLTGLADADVTVVVALGGRDPEAISVPIPANARVSRYIPFDRLLPLTDVFVTNGGAGGLHQSLAAGVPVVVAGTTEDKPANAARIADHRLGADLGTATPSPSVVASAVTTLLTDDGIRENVERLAKVYAEHDAVALIERLTIG